MKIALAVILFLVLIFICVQVYFFFVQEHSLGTDLADITAQLTKEQADETDLQSEVKYLANPLNLEKELRARFNYKKPGETMIVIVPGSASSTSVSD